MKASWFGFLLSPKFSNYEQGQKAKLLHYMLAAIFIGGLVTVISNFVNGWYIEAILLSLLAIVCLIGFYLNRTGHFILAAWIVCISLFSVISLLLYYGIGLYDSTVLAYPLFIICTTFLFGRRGLFTATLFSIAAVFAIYILEVYGYFIPTLPVTFLRAVMTAIIFAVIALVMWIVRDTWEMNLKLLNDSYELTLHGWARAIEYRDGETAGHSYRVTELSVAIARALGLDDEEVLNVRRGSYLHDIGKMAIPDHILLKPGPLTDDEWEIMKQHPVRSREFIAEIPFLQAAIPIAYYHHEHWDGTGYPEGLRGDEIPLPARIFTVADHWDALNSDRPYRKAWPREKVIAYLRENTGKIYDPHIVDVFLSIVPKN